VSFFKWAKDKVTGQKSWRELTQNEIALARTVFKDCINYKAVRLYNRTIQPVGQAKNRAVAYNNKISFPGTSYSNDFGLDDDVIKQSVFIHELFHVWQQQNDVLDTRIDFISEMIEHKGDYQACYRYTLDENKDLLDYDFEQQAAIVNDYFLWQSGIKESFKNRCLNDEPQEKMERLYKKVLSRFFNDSAYARLNEKKAYSALLSSILPKESYKTFPPN